MIRQKLAVGAVAAAFALSLSTAYASQDRGRPESGGGGGGQAGSRSGGDAGGSAVPRGGDSGASSSTPSGGGGGGGGGSAAPGFAGGGAGGAYNAPERAPERPGHIARGAERSADRADQRRGGGGGAPSGHATPRSSGSNGGGDHATRGSGDTSVRAGSDDRGGGNRTPVPTYSRPRDGRTPIGTAVERRGTVPGRDGYIYYPTVFYDPSYYYYDPYYSRRYTSFWNPYGYGYGFGYFSYDPFLFGYGAYDPYYGGGGYGYGGGGYGSGYGYSQGYRDVGSLRLKVKPSNAQVYIDGYYVGVIDNFDGVFQKLGIDAGPHKIEIKADGYEPAQFEVMVTPGETVTYRGELKRR